jgi:Tfp pilus assembly protein PilE
MAKETLVGLIIVLILMTVFVLLAGCSYGTYYSTGSHANEDNSVHCDKQKG